MKKNIKTIIELHVLLMVYSISGVFSKLASGDAFMSGRFILHYAGIVAILAIYAIGWQQIIKRMPLTTAFANKAVCTIWGSIWGVLLFGESVSVGKIIGIVLIVIGIVLFATEKEALDE